MRCLAVAAIAVTLAAVPVARADVAITVDKDAQQMTVAVDGQVRYRWPVSTGNPSYETPNGTHRAFRMEPDHFSKEFDDAPMPHSIFFTKRGHAIHGTFSEKSLGVPVSHGCVRLSRAHAATLYKLVEDQGVLKTTVTLTGSSRVALARLKGEPKTTAVARRDSAPDYDANGQPLAAPRQIVPRPLYAQPAPPDMADNGDIAEAAPAPAPAPRRYRRMPEAQVYAYEGPNYRRRSYYDFVDTPRAYAPPPGYYGGYGGRGLFNSGW
ncbi:MAG: L,D-transpeptidase [Xanthobacteraceae bacterium]